MFLLIDEPLPVSVDARIRKRVNFRFLIPENRLSANVSPASVAKNLEARALSDIPTIIVLPEKVAAVCLRQFEGRVDYAGFFGTDLTSHNWVKDLFLYCWEKGKRAYRLQILNFERKLA